MAEGRCDGCGTVEPGRRGVWRELDRSPDAPAGCFRPARFLCGRCLDARLDAYLAGDDQEPPQPWGDVDQLRALGELRAAWLGRGPDHR